MRAMRSTDSRRCLPPAPLAHALASHWTALQGEVGDSVAGPLREPARAAGAGCAKVQRSLTAQREQVRFQALDVEIRALPAEDMRRAAWVNVDRFSTVWVTALPVYEACVSNAEFLEIATY